MAPPDDALDDQADEPRRSSRSVSPPSPSPSPSTRRTAGSSGPSGRRPPSCARPDPAVRELLVLLPLRGDRQHLLTRLGVLGPLAPDADLAEGLVAATHVLQVASRAGTHRDWASSSAKHFYSLRIAPNIWVYPVWFSSMGQHLRRVSEPSALHQTFGFTRLSRILLVEALPTKL